jgi:hypothetical protein
MPAAERSVKGAVEHQKDICFPEEIGEAHTFSAEILQGEVGGRYIQGYSWHKVSPEWVCDIA